MRGRARSRASGARARGARPRAWRALLAAPVLLALAGGPLRAQSGDGAPPAEARDARAVEEELAARRWALFPGDSAAAIAAALASARWNDRARALDALARGLAAGVAATDLHRAAVARGLDDAHPSVRERALNLAAVLAEPGLVGPARASALAAEPLGAVRLSLARALAAGAGDAIDAVDGGGDTGARLLALSDDADERVARAARLGLVARGDRDPDALFTLVAFVLTGGSDAEAEELLEALYDAPVGLALARRLRAVSTGRVADAALLDLLVVARGGGVDPTWSGLSGALEHAATWSSDRRALLAVAARAWDPELARLLVRALAAAARDLQAEKATHAACFDLAEAAARGARPAEVARLAAELDGAELPGDGLAFLIQALSSRVAAWGAADPGAPLEAIAAGWLAPERPRVVRAAVVDACVLTLGRDGDLAAARLLARALDDPDPALSRRAFRALGDAPGGPREDAALLVAWRRLPDRDRLQRLARVSRAAPLTAFRADLLRWGDHPDPRRPAAAELLAAFTGDAGVCAALEGWLQDELDRVDAGWTATDADGAGSDGVEKLDGAAARAATVLRALARAAPPAVTLDLAEGALRRTHDRAEETAKAAAAVLGATPAGRARLASWLGEEVGRRARVEAAIALASHPEEGRAGAAAAALIRDYDHVAWDLGVRVVEALGQAGEARSCAFLAGLSRDGDAYERAAALTALAHRPEGDAEQALERAAAHDHDLEVRRLAVRMLGERGAEDALARVASAFASQPLTADVARVLREDLAAARARAGDHGPEAVAGWLATPLAAAADAAGRRLRGESLPDPRFEWRPTLEVAAELADVGRLDAELARAGAWWELDGAMLLALAERAAPEPEALDQLLAAGIVATSGERAPVPRELGNARGRLLGRLWASERWDAFARVATAFLDDHLTGDLPAQSFEAALGAPDRARGVDPVARLESAVLQARARAALERGDRGRAARLAADAAARTGSSALARAEQARLEALLAERDAGR